MAVGEQLGLCWLWVQVGGRNYSKLTTSIRVYQFAY